MSFKLFIYYCALCGGWAAFVAALLVQLSGVVRLESVLLSTIVTAGIVGLLLAAAIGFVDALLNAVGSQRVIRVLVSLGVGLLGGIVGGLLGYILKKYLAIDMLGKASNLPGFMLGWMVVGVAIGASVGVYDLVRARGNEQAGGVARRKTINGIVGGALGGLLGGLLYWVLLSVLSLPRFSLAAGLVILGAAIGLLIGLAQVILKEAWLRVESGFRAGREMMLSKEETTIGRAESCDIGLFGDTTVEKTHARILMQGNRYLLEHVGSDGSTLLNDGPVSQPTPLRSGDLIRVGNSVLRFGERRKQPNA